MKCNQIREFMPDLAAGLTVKLPEVDNHLQSCVECAAKLAGLRQTMALLDEWQVPEPSPYFDVRLRARLHEEQSKASGWLQWIRKPAMAFALTVLLAVGASLFRSSPSLPDIHASLPAPWNPPQTQASAEPGTAVGDLQMLDKNHDLYSDFDLLDDLAVEQDVTANP